MERNTKTTGIYEGAVHQGSQVAAKFKTNILPWFQIKSWVNLSESKEIEKIVQILLLKNLK